MAYLLYCPVIVLKQELLRLPLLGFYFRKAGCIAHDRSAGMKALRQLCGHRRGKRALGADFSAGDTRCPGAEHKYEIGIFAVYEATGLPVVPVALNSGHVWGRNGWRKYPGVIDVDFLPAIPPDWTEKALWPRLIRH